MKSTNSILALTVILTAAVSQYRFINIGGAQSTAAAESLGVSRTDGEIGDAIAADVIGTTAVTAGAAIAKGAAIEVGADGKAVTKAAGVTVARAMEAAAVDGDLIEVTLIAN